MKITDILIDIGRPVAFHPGLKKITKSTTATLFLCQLIYWIGKQADPDGWIYKTSGEIETETGLTYKEQITARKNLIKLGFVEEKYKRLEHKIIFRVLINTINDAWENNCQTSILPMVSSPNDYLVDSELTIGATANLPSGDSLTEITAEITTETTTFKNNKEAFAKICKFYEQEIGPLTGMISDEIGLSVEEYPIEWFQPAFREAAMAQARNWKYVLAILKNWKSHGYGWKPKKPGDRLKTGTQLRNL